MRCEMGMISFWNLIRGRPEMEKQCEHDPM